MARTTSLRASNLIVLATICVTVAALYFAQAVLIPLALAILVSFLLSPVVDRLENSGVYRVVAVIVVFSVCLALVAVLGWMVYLQVEDLAEQLPRYRDDIVAKVQSITGSEPGAFGKAADVIEDVSRAVSDPATTPTQPASPPGDRGARSRTTGAEWSVIHPLPVTVVTERTSPTQFVGAYVDRLLGPLGTAGLVMVFVFFILLQREDLRDRLIRLVGYGQLNVTTQALDDAAGRISRYLLAQVIVNGTYGIAISLGLWLIGHFVAGETFPNLVLWGLLCAVLRFIPYIGPWIAAAFPIALAFAVFPGYSVFVAVGVMFIVVELLSNNFMEPWLYGTSTGMSTVAVLVAAVFWTWLWGPIGLVMATPLTVCLVVMGKYVPPLKFFDILLGDEPVLDPPERVYQRLLAMDQEEATEIVQDHLKTEPPEQVFDTILVPALSFAEQDRSAGRLDDSRAQFVRTAIRQIVEEVADQQKAAARPAEPCRVNIVLLPAHDEADDIVAAMLAQLCELRGYCAFPLAHTALASEMMQRVEQDKADIVVVSSLPPAAVAHSRYVCKRLYARFPEINTVVGLWTLRGDLSKARDRIACGDAVKVASTFSTALEQMHEFAEAKLLQTETA